MKASVIYWSGTGNTEAMANEIAAKLKELGADTKLVSVEEASLDDAKEAELLALGCPAMGAEELEEDYFRPYFDSIIYYIGEEYNVKIQDIDPNELGLEDDFSISLPMIILIIFIFLIVTSRLNRYRYLYG